MYILSADTSAKTASVCVSKLDGKRLIPLCLSTVNGTLTHSESLLPMIDFCLKNAKVSIDEIETLAISEGPGSFTGVRIGISTFKGLAYKKENTGAVGVSTLEALAYNVCSYPSSLIILPLMDARRNQFYNAFFKATSNGSIKRLGKDDLLTFDEIISIIRTSYKNKKILITGDGAELFEKLYEKSGISDIKIKLCDYSHMYENAFSVALCAVKKIEKSRDLSLYTAEKLNPVYLRASQAERERNEKLSERGL